MANGPFGNYQMGLWAQEACRFGVGTRGQVGPGMLLSTPSPTLVAWHSYVTSSACLTAGDGLQRVLLVPLFLRISRAFLGKQWMEQRELCPWL